MSFTTPHRVTVNRRPADYRSGIQSMDDNPRKGVIPLWFSVGVIAFATGLAVFQ